MQYLRNSNYDVCFKCMCLITVYLQTRATIRLKQLSIRFREISKDIRPHLYHGLTHSTGKALITVSVQIFSNEYRLATINSEFYALVSCFVLNIYVKRGGSCKASYVYFWFCFNYTFCFLV